MKRKYTFIVGAGASKEFGFPVGNELVHKISQFLQVKFDDFGSVKGGDRNVIAALSQLKHPDTSKSLNMGYIYAQANWISDNMGLAASIDNFLDAHRRRVLVPEIGKIAIARAILEAERNSLLFVDPMKRNSSRQFADFPPNWLTNLFRILTTRRDFESFRIALRSFRFVTFNYDRTIEQFFAAAIQSYYELRPDKLNEVLAEDLNVCHVYGSLGPISGGNGVEFGGLHSQHAVFDGAQNIKTFTEGASDVGEIEQAKDWCEDANFLFFLGCAFHPLNIDALKPADCYSTKPVYGTRLGMSEDNVNIATNSLSYNWFDRPKLPMDLRNIRGHELIDQLSGLLLESDILE